MATDSGDIPMSVVTAQPSNVQEGQADAEVEEVPPSLTGLGPLRSGNHFKVKQKIRLKDICGDICGCEAEKKYAIQGEQGETLYWAKESSSCGPRWCLANIRPLHISLQDQTGREVALIRRPLNCMGCCCNGLCYPHCTQKAAVSVEGKEAGFVRERATWCYPVFHLFDPSGAQAFKVRGPLCHLGCTCSDVVFFVTSMASGVEVARVTKRWLGVCAEAAIDADRFDVDFVQPDMSVEEKTLILSTVFLIDLMYYEGDSL